jgi:hypothetical protein
MSIIISEDVYGWLDGIGTEQGNNGRQRNTAYCTDSKLLKCIDVLK